MSIIRRTVPNIVQAYRPPTPIVIHVEIHDPDCPCEYCPNGDRLTVVDMGKLACLGAAVASAIMFTYDPAGAAAALLATIGIVS